MMAATHWLDAIEREVGGFTASSAFLTQCGENFSALFTRPNYLTANLFFAHGARKSRKLNFSQPQNFAGNSGADS